MTDEKKTLLDRLDASQQIVREGSTDFWRQAIAEAVMGTLKAGKPLSVEGLVEFLSDAPENWNHLLLVKSREEAIKKLSTFL